MAIRRRPGSTWKLLALIVGIAAHLAVGVLYLVIGLVVPALWLPLFWAFWVFLLVMALRRNDNPAWVLATPVVALAVLLAGVSLGEAVFGWTA